MKEPAEGLVLVLMFQLCIPDPCDSEKYGCCSSCFNEVSHSLPSFLNLLGWHFVTFSHQSAIWHLPLCLLPRLILVRSHSVPLSFLSYMHLNSLFGPQWSPCNQQGPSRRWSPMQCSTWLAGIWILTRSWFCGSALAQWCFLCPWSPKKLFLIQKIGEQKRDSEN